MEIKKIDDFTNQTTIKANEHIGESLRDKNGYDAIYEMASVGYFGDKNVKDGSVPQKFKVFVNGKEGPVPHFHVWDDDTDGQEFHTCVCINKVEYFHHTGKEDSFDSKQKKKLMEFLKASPNNPRYKTHFEYICSMWNDNNPTQTKVDENADIPNYIEL